MYGRGLLGYVMKMDYIKRLTLAEHLHLHKRELNYISGK